MRYLEIFTKSKSIFRPFQHTLRESQPCSVSEFLKLLVFWGLIWGSRNK